MFSVGNLQCRCARATGDELTTLRNHSFVDLLYFCMSFLPSVHLHTLYVCLSVSPSVSLSLQQLPVQIHLLVPSSSVRYLQQSVCSEWEIGLALPVPGRLAVLYPVYTIKQTSIWIVQLTWTSQLVEPAWSCKRGITVAIDFTGRQQSVYRSPVDCYCSVTITLSYRLHEVVTLSKLFSVCSH